MVTIRNFIRIIVLRVRYFILTRIYKMDISNSARISFGTKLDKTYPQGIHIGDESYFASGSIMFSHDFSRNLKVDTYVGRRCFVGANAIIMAGIRIGDEVIIGSGSIVTKDIPSKCIVAGNPARILKENISTSKFGQLRDGK
jgi:acetyltransferase-like isoleucine patch superfamily enzyme